MAFEQTILVTGGAGFIGSHTCVELLQTGYDVVIVDDLSNSHVKAVERVRQIVRDAETAGEAPAGASEHVEFIQADILDKESLSAVFDTHDIHAVIHFAGLKAVGESVRKPLEYYHNNLTGTFVLCDVMREHGCKNIVFSSSATVYGEGNPVPYVETMQKHPATNPYGWTKWMIEQVLTDLSAADPEWNVVLLRYFNPIGAHPSGLIGEDPKGIPNNLVPYVAQVAVGKLEAVGVFGNDYDTPDGTGVRDYIHVVDLARGHIAALKWMEGRSGTEIVNLGSGKGSSVLDVIRSFSRACGRDLPYVIKPRRDGDLAETYADASKAKELFGWETQYDLDRMCEDSWRWQSSNPNGYKD
ncbi:UDP-glucose 4-epimerase GalE [Slackia heliotrinireducens]|uniref:UDP-glucose 4-epimerase n=1 Tax=Slackia heliotrinireducens (strain ATCC 29202 / DSM 20476 / NCTC 11029 / RHS 1) TaxID=471855 RepID=C7N407_SLAHD|nr:UDP-glucose 4-epimerase GalE [Slackia heliotrinireducens]ACV23743.1 UDP-galactose 4-epimerase [Slackia heliotrinireducens DSM 20476]VEH03353.1 UDP-glucose 4-epimerase [Slackia heliotrinireducens]